LGLGVRDAANQVAKLARRPSPIIPRKKKERREDIVKEEGTYELKIVVCRNISTLNKRE